MRARLRRLLAALRLWWDRPDPMAALDSIEHRQAEAIHAAVEGVHGDDAAALMRIYELTAGRDCPVCAEVFRIAEARVGEGP